MGPLRKTGVLVVALWSVATPAQALDAAGLQSALAREAAKLGPSAGALVVDQTTGRTLFSRRPDLDLVPASNEKLFTTAAALTTFGADGVRQTVARGLPGVLPDDEGRLRGDLFLVGGGDPTLTDLRLGEMAEELVEQDGLLAVTGGVVGDESLLDRRRGSVDSGFKPSFDLGGQLGALVVGHGAATSKGPAFVAASRFQAALKRRGVRFGKQARTGLAPPAEEAQPPLATLTSPPMASIIAVTNTQSDNFYAEMLLKLLGRELAASGSTSAGARAMAEKLRPLGVTPTIADGSGLSRANRTTAREVVTLLLAMDEPPLDEAWRASMTVAGRTGTLRRRMRGTAAAGRCRGKTGTLRGVSALSGYCTTTTGDRVVFSFLENGVGPGAKDVEDRMVAAVARYDG